MERGDEALEAFLAANPAARLAREARIEEAVRVAQEERDRERDWQEERRIYEAVR